MFDFFYFIAFAKYPPNLFQTKTIGFKLPTSSFTSFNIDSENIAYIADIPLRETK